ncbi:MAG: hypothetical protein IJT64_01155 [Kiritimatiellae bacterium]|nr:hypothetical protein [Kiritimatiellia bacterium]
MGAIPFLIVAIVVALAVLAVIRNFRKGAPCECGGTRRIQDGSCSACPKSACPHCREAAEKKEAR